MPAFSPFWITVPLALAMAALAIFLARTGQARRDEKADMTPAQAPAQTSSTLVDLASAGFTLVPQQSRTEHQGSSGQEPSGRSGNGYLDASRRQAFARALSAYAVVTEARMLQIWVHLSAPAGHRLYRELRDLLTAAGWTVTGPHTTSVPEHAEGLRVIGRHSQKRSVIVEALRAADFGPTVEHRKDVDLQIVIGAD